MKYVKNKNNGKVYNCYNSVHWVAITNAICDEFGADFIKNECNFPIIDSFILDNLEISEGVLSEYSTEQMPDSLVEIITQTYKRNIIQKERYQYKNLELLLDKYADSQAEANKLFFDIIKIIEKTNFKDAADVLNSCLYQTEPYNWINIIKDLYKKNNKI